MQENKVTYELNMVIVNSSFYIAVVLSIMNNHCSSRFIPHFCSLTFLGC